MGYRVHIRHVGQIGYVCYICDVGYIRYMITVGTLGTAGYIGRKEHTIFKWCTGYIVYVRYLRYHSLNRLQPGTWYTGHIGYMDPLRNRCAMDS